MGRLIEVQQVHRCPRSLTLRAGDVLAVTATGGRVRSGTRVIEMLGPFVPAVLAESGQILSPAGTPNAVMFVARREGRSAVDVVTGEPWGVARTTTLDLLVES